MPKNVNAVTVKMAEPYPVASRDFIFEKSPSYLLTNQLLTIPDNYIAKVCFKYDAPRTVTKSQDKKITKVAKLRGERNEEEFFVIFEPKSLEQRGRTLPLKWCTNDASVKYPNGTYKVASQGSFSLKIIDTKKFVDAAGNGEPGRYSALSVSEKIIREVEQKAREILENMFKNVRVFISDAVYLTDEYNLRLENFFFYDEDIFSKYGMQLTSFKANTITVSPLAINAEKTRLQQLADKEEALRMIEEQRRQQEEEKARALAEEQARLKAEEEAISEQEKKEEAAVIAEDAAQRAEDAAFKAMQNVTHFIELAKKSEQDALAQATKAKESESLAVKRAAEAERSRQEALKRATDAEKRVEELEKLVNAYRTAKAAAKSKKE